MKIADDCVVGIEYSLHLGDGQIIDGSDGEPLHFIQGAGQIVPGLEQALSGLEPGAEQRIVIDPEQGYGQRDPTAVRVVSRQAFPDDAPVEAGAELMLVDDQQRQIPIRISQVEGDQVTVDFNHPLAGKTLHFSVKIVDVREATPEELEHGHAHEDGVEH